eukprot:156308_1
MAQSKDDNQCESGLEIQSDWENVMEGDVGDTYDDGSDTYDDRSDTYDDGLSLFNNQQMESGLHVQSDWESSIEDGDIYIANTYDEDAEQYGSHDELPDENESCEDTFSSSGCLIAVLPFDDENRIWELIKHITILKQTLEAHENYLQFILHEIIN